MHSISLPVMTWGEGGVHWCTLPIANGHKYETAIRHLLGNLSVSNPVKDLGPIAKVKVVWICVFRVGTEVV